MWGQFWTCTSCHNVQHPIAMCIINSYRTTRFQVRVEQVHLLSSLHHLVHITESLSIPYQIFDQCFITLHLIWKSELPVIQVSMPFWGLINFTGHHHLAAFRCNPGFWCTKDNKQRLIQVLPIPKEARQDHGCRCGDDLLYFLPIGCFAGQMSQMGGK